MQNIWTTTARGKFFFRRGVYRENLSYVIDDVFVSIVWIKLPTAGSEPEPQQIQNIFTVYRIQTPQSLEFEFYVPVYTNNSKRFIGVQ